MCLSGVSVASGQRWPTLMPILTLCRGVWFFVCLLIKELLHRSSYGKKLHLSQHSNNASASHGWAAVRRWWRPNGFRERPPERSVTKIDPMWVWFVLKPQYQKCEPRGGFRLDILAHSCRPFGRRVCHVSSGELAASPHPSGKTGSMTEFRFTPKLKSNPPSVYKMCHYVIMSHTHTKKKHNTSSQSQTCLNFCGLCLLGDSIWPVNRKWEGVVERSLSTSETNNNEHEGV